MLLTESEIRSIAEKTLRIVSADDASVTVSTTDNSHLRFAANAFLTNGRQENATVSITVWIGRKRGQSTTNDLSDSALKATVRQAESIARLSPIDREYLPTLGAESYKPTGGFADSTVDFSVTDRARRIHQIISSCERSGVIGAGFHQARGSAAGTATKNGNFRYERTSRAALTVTARTRQGDASGFFQRGHWDINRLDTDRVAREAIEKALTSREAKEMAPGVYPVILEPQAVADLLGFMARFGFDARNAEEGRSALSAPGGKTKVGQQIFDSKINIYSDPWHPELPDSPYAQDGVPSQRLVLVDKGVLKTLVYSRFWASQRGISPSPGPVNLIMESADKPASIDEMIAASERALLVTRFWYIRGVNPRIQLNTGLTRDGLWYVEHGKIKHPVRNFRFNESMIAMLAPGKVGMVGRPERVSGSESRGGNDSLLPALKLREFHFTSLSEAV